MFKVCLTIKKMHCKSNKCTVLITVVSNGNPKKLSQLSHAYIYNPPLVFYLESKVKICTAFFPHKRASH